MPFTIPVAPPLRPYSHYIPWSIASQWLIWQSDITVCRVVGPCVRESPRVASSPFSNCVLASVDRGVPLLLVGCAVLVALPVHGTIAGTSEPITEIGKEVQSFCK